MFGFLKRRKRVAIDTSGWSSREFACLRAHMGMYMMEPTIGKQLHDDILVGHLQPIRAVDDIGKAEAHCAQVVEIEPDDPPDPENDDEGDDRDESPVSSGTRRIMLLSIDGLMTKHWSKFGGTSTNFLRSALSEAASDRKIDGVMLFIDSPGGQAAGTDQLYEAIRDVAAEKPVHAYIDDACFSAALYVAAAATRITAQPTARAGSVGVVLAIDDVSGQYEKSGIKTRIIRSWPRKAMIVDGEPISDEALEQLRPGVETTARRFVDQVAGARSLKAVYGEGWATGDWWVAEQAKAMGLIDDVQSFDQAMNALLGAIEGPGIERKGRREVAAQEESGDAPGTTGGGMDPRLKTVLSALKLDEDASETEITKALEAVTISEQHVVLTRAEMEALQKQVTETRDELTRAKAEKAVDALLKAEGGPRITKAQTDWAVDYYCTAGAKAFESWAETLSPIVGLEPNGVGGRSEPSVDASEVEREIDQKVSAHMKETGEEDLERATSTVLDANPELVARLDAISELEVR